MSVSDDQLREMWRAAGGTFYGPKVEHGDMEEAKLLPFLRQLVEERDKASASAARAEASENALRSEIEAAFRKHGMAAGPRAIDALVEARDKASAEAEDQRLQQVAHHASMSGTIDDLRFRLSAAEAARARNAVEASELRHELHEYKETAAACMAGRDKAQAELQSAQDQHAIAVERLGDSFKVQLDEKGRTILDHQSYIAELIKLLTEVRGALLRVSTSYQRQGVGAFSLLEMVKRLDQVIKGKPQN